MIKLNSDEPSTLPVLAHSIRETSRITSVQRSSLYEAIKRGDLKARKFGRRTVILDSDLRAWLESAPSIQKAA